MAVELITKEQLLIEIEDLLRTMPPQTTICEGTQENYAWAGRLSAVIQKWNFGEGLLLSIALDQLHSYVGLSEGFRKIITLLHQARHDLRMQTLGPVNVALSKGEVFDYFDEIRKTIEVAKRDVLFIDPYLDAEFVSRYLGHITPGVTTRLLAREKLPTLLPAVDAFVQQFKMKIEVRSASNFHDRYVFIDGVACYHSGASFKDGAKSAPTTLTQITDAFAALSKTYEDLWNGAKIER